MSIALQYTISNSSDLTEWTLIVISYLPLFRAFRLTSSIDYPDSWIADIREIRVRVA